MPRALVVAARQPDFSSLLEAAGYDVIVQTKPLDAEPAHADVAVVFRGRLIGRNQAAALAAAGVPVVEVFTATPTARSSGNWIRVSNRVTKSDLVQIVHALADSGVGARPAATR
jgi:hypothetical protein